MKKLVTEEEIDDFFDKPIYIGNIVDDRDYRYCIFSDKSSWRDMQKQWKNQIKKILEKNDLYEEGENEEIYNDFINKDETVDFSDFIEKDFGEELYNSHKKVTKKRLSHETIQNVVDELKEIRYEMIEKNSDIIAKTNVEEKIWNFIIKKTLEKYGLYEYRKNTKLYNKFIKYNESIFTRFKPGKFYDLLIYCFQKKYKRDPSPSEMENMEQIVKEMINAYVDFKRNIKTKDVNQINDPYKRTHALLKSKGKYSKYLKNPVNIGNFQIYCEVEGKKAKLSFLRKLTEDEKKHYKKIRKNISRHTTKKLVNWELLHTRTKQFFNELKKGKVQGIRTPKKKVKFKGQSKDSELTYVDCTGIEDYKFVVNSWAWLRKYKLDQLRNEILGSESKERFFDRKPLLSCTYLDNKMHTYGVTDANSFSKDNIDKKLVYSWIFDLDPLSISGTFEMDVGSPERGLDSYKQYDKYLRKTTASTLKKDIEEAENIEQKKKRIFHKQRIRNLPLYTPERLAKKTRREKGRAYNEMIVYSGCYADNLGVKRPKIKGILIEKRNLDRVLNYNNSGNVLGDNAIGIIDALQKITEKLNIPIIVVDTFKPRVQLDIYEQADAIFENSLREPKFKFHKNLGKKSKVIDDEGEEVTKVNLIESKANENLDIVKSNLDKVLLEIDAVKSKAEYKKYVKVLEKFKAQFVKLKEKQISQLKKAYRFNKKHSVKDRHDNAKNINFDDHDIKGMLYDFITKLDMEHQALIQLVLTRAQVALMEKFIDAYKSNDTMDQTLLENKLKKLKKQRDILRENVKVYREELTFQRTIKEKKLYKKMQTPKKFSK